MTARTLSILISTVTESTVDSETRETVRIIEKEFLQSFAPYVTPLFIAANSAEQMKKKLYDQVGPNDKIIRLVFLGHGFSMVDGFGFNFNQSENLRVKNKDLNLKARLFFAPIYGKFLDGAIIHFANCNLFAGTKSVALEKANQLRSILGIKNGFFYGNNEIGDTFNYFAGFRDMIQARKLWIMKMLIPVYLILVGSTMPFWVPDMAERMSALLLITGVIAADLIYKRLMALKITGYLFQIKNQIVLTDFISVSEFINYRTNVLANRNSLVCESLFL